MSCEHRRTHPSSCDDCGEPWCGVCVTYHRAGTVFECASKLRARIAELEHAIVGMRGIVENWREAVHSDYGAMAAIEDHLSRVPSDPLDLDLSHGGKAGPRTSEAPISVGDLVRRRGMGRVTRRYRRGNEPTDRVDVLWNEGGQHTESEIWEYPSSLERIPRPTETRDPADCNGSGVYSGICSRGKRGCNTLHPEAPRTDYPSAAVPLSSGEVCWTIQRAVDHATDETRPGLLVAYDAVLGLASRRGARAETAHPALTEAVLVAAALLVDVLRSDERADEEQEALCFAVEAWRAMPTGGTP